VSVRVQAMKHHPYARSAGGAALLFGLVAYVANSFVKEKASSADEATTAKSVT
jgi:hypothetical protein